MCGSQSDTYQILGKRLNGSQGKRPRAHIGVTTTIVECNVCGLIFSDPLPIPASLEDHYGLDPKYYWKDEYFHSEGEYFKDQIARFHQLYGKEGQLIALDIGAGIGKCMQALVRAGFDAFGLEGSRTFYRTAIELNRISPDRLSLARIEEANFNQNSFDFITFGAVLEHLYDPSSAILKALEWLKPEGLIHVEVPSSRWLVNRLGNLFYRITGTDYVANLSPMHPPYHLYEFSLDSFNRHAERFGYQVVHYQYYVAQTFMPRLISHVMTPIMRATKTGMQLEVWLKKPGSKA